jgi:hypothetical protein
MSAAIVAGATSRHTTVRVKITPGPAPLDLARLEADLDTQVEITRRNLRCAKLAHDAQLLRTALAARAFGLDLATAQERLEDKAGDVHLQQAADRMLADALRMAGWTQDTPDPNPQREYKDTRGILGSRLPERRGQERSEDVLVNLDNGTTIVATATGAFDYHWEYPWRELPKPLDRHAPWNFERVEPEAIAHPGRWWNTGKYTADLDLGGGHWSASSDITKRTDARKALTVPALPVDLDAVLREIRRRP